MKTYLTEDRVRELSKQLHEACTENNPAKIESIIRQAAAEAVASYRKWLQSDSGTD